MSSRLYGLTLLRVTGLLALALAACGDDSETSVTPTQTGGQGGAQGGSAPTGGSGPTGGSSPAGGAAGSTGGTGGVAGANGGSSPAGAGGGQKPPITFLGFKGDYGDIGIRFSLAPANAANQSVTLEYRGCSATQFTSAILLDSALAKDLAPGEHEFTWASWEQEAGCDAEVVFRLTTSQKDSAESSPLDLNNTGVNSGFVEFVQVDQGIDASETSQYEASLKVLLDVPSLDFVATRVGATYEVHAKRGSVVFQRVSTNQGYRYDVLKVTAQNPIENQDPAAFPTLAEELARGSNPNNVSYPSLGYDPGDPRLSFIEPEEDSYPYGYERIAAFFDHPDAPDLMLNYRGYGRGQGGSHGTLGMVQSRCPLILWGKGIVPGEKASSARQVDLAPTVGRLLDMPYVDGVDERGIRSHFVRVRWQDGHEIPGVLDGTLAKYVILVVSDGLNHAQLHDKINRDPGAVPHLAKLRSEGAWLSQGSITNWPSNTYPCHNVVGSGIYSGHHGLVDNTYYLRTASKVATPLDDKVNTAHYWNPLLPEGETLHHASHRAFGNWVDVPATGAYTASVLDPSVAGANTADLEFKDDSGQINFPIQNLVPPMEVPWPNVLPTSEQEAFAAQTLMRFGMAELKLLYTSSTIPKPRYTVLNHTCTDVLGHEWGPHGDRINNAIEHLDAHLGMLLDWLGDWGILGEVAIILTADHGMQLGDETRTGSMKQPLTDAGISFVDGTAGWNVYFP